MEEQHIPKELLDMLACPVCKEKLNYNEDNTALLCAKCGSKYKIQDGIPVLIAPKGKDAKDEGKETKE